MKHLMGQSNLNNAFVEYSRMIYTILVSSWCLHFKMCSMLCHVWLHFRNVLTKYLKYGNATQIRVSYPAFVSSPETCFLVNCFKSFRVIPFRNVSWKFLHFYLFASFHFVKRLVILNRFLIFERVILKYFLF